MKNLAFLFTGVIAFLLMAQFLHGQHSPVRTQSHNLDDTTDEAIYTPPNRGFPATTLPSGTR